jgi:hypothetical protein
MTVAPAVPASVGRASSPAVPTILSVTMNSMNPANVDELFARVVLTPPSKKRTSPVSGPEPPGSIADGTIERIWREERERR